LIETSPPHAHTPLRLRHCRITRARAGVSCGAELTRHQLGQCLLHPDTIVFIPVDQQRPDRPVTAVGSDLIEADTGLRCGLQRRSDARVPQAVTPDVQADAPPALADDPQDRAPLQASVLLLASAPTRQKERTSNRPAMLQISPDRAHNALAMRADRRSGLIEPSRLFFLDPVEHRDGIRRMNAVRPLRHTLQQSDRLARRCRVGTPAACHASRQAFSHSGIVRREGVLRLSLTPSRACSHLKLSHSAISSPTLDR